MVNSLETRAQKLGTLIREAREHAGQTVEICARVMKVSPETFAAYESGEKSPSLPSIENLAIYLNIPVDFFLGRAPLPRVQAGPPALDTLDSLLSLRNRIVSALLRKMRLESGITLDELSRYVEVSPEQLQAYETGQYPIPLPKLEMICLALNVSIRDFLDTSGPVGRWNQQQKAVNAFLELPPEMQQFISQPVNLPYLNLAQRLSEMSVDRLRNVAEGLLEITL